MYRAFPLAALLVATGFLLHPTWADERVRREAEKAREVKLLEAEHKGEIEVRWIAFSSSEGRMIVTNKTEEPLKVVVPSELTAEHVVPAESRTGRAQTLGIGPHAGKGYQQNGYFSEGPDASFFFVPAGKTSRADFPSVCLEFGRPDPTKNKRYVLRGVVGFTNREPISAMLRAWHSQRFSQSVAQAAGWRLADGLSWERMASLRVTTVGAFAVGQPLFTARDLTAAQQVAEGATAAADKKAAERAP